MEELGTSGAGLLAVQGTRAWDELPTGPYKAWARLLATPKISGTGLDFALDGQVCEGVGNSLEGKDNFFLLLCSLCKETMLEMPQFP